MIKQEYIKDPTKFSGLLYESDFDTYQKPYKGMSKGSYIAERIMSDWRFDKVCCQNILTRDRVRPSMINFSNGSSIITIPYKELKRSPRAELYLK